MLSERLQHRKDAGARPEPDPRSRPGTGQPSQSLVVSGKAFSRYRAVTSRQGIKRRIEFGVKFEPASDPAKSNDLGPYRESCQQLRAL
jgi:hypothetical protein